jgi:hypothetical protein
MQKQEKEIEGNKENGRIQVIFFDTKKGKDYEEMKKKWERLYHDTDGWLDKDYLIVRKIDESQFR